MSTFNQAEFDRFVIENRVIGFFDKPITLKSGRKSYWYVNWRTVAEDVYLTDRLAGYVIQFTSDLAATKKLALEPRCFYGVPEGASKLALITQYKWALQAKNFAAGSYPLAMGRGKPKEHGDPKDKYFVGEPKGPTILLEDVTTTGGSLLTAIESLREIDIPIIAAIGLTNRMEKRDDGRSVSEAIGALTSHGKPITYYHMSSALRLLPQAAQIHSLDASVRTAIEKEFEEFGVEPLKWS